jgi:predicted nucleic acid-binding protein
MTLLLDTTVLIDALRRKNVALTLLAEAVALGHQFSTSAISIAEVFSGSRLAEETTTQAFLENILCFPVTYSIAERGGRLRNDWARKGRTLGLADMVVAATALEHNLALVTANRKDFPMPELKFYPTA